MMNKRLRYKLYKSAQPGATAKIQEMNRRLEEAGFVVDDSLPNQGRGGAFAIWFSNKTDGYELMVYADSWRLDEVYDDGTEEEVAGGSERTPKQIVDAILRELG